MALPIYAQGKINVKGLVVDDKQEALIGVNVRIKGTTQGVATDLDGKFTLQGVPEDASLEFSYVGMKTRFVAVKGRSFIKVQMQSSATDLDDLVVVAYGRQKKANLIGAVSSLDSKALKSRPVQNLEQALQGLVPGLNLSVNNGGALDSKMDMNIRGAGTIGDGSNSAPLVLIDGVEGNMNALSPQDIASISILKDAASSSIYGSRAAFGVILITTKSGKKGKAKISYNGNVRFSTPTNLPKMMNSLDFANYFNQGLKNGGQGAFFSEENVAKIKDYLNGVERPNDPDFKYGTYWNAKGGKWAWWGGPWANTDWFEEAYGKNAPTHEHSLAISGGSEKVNYYLSGSFLSRKGLVNWGKDTFKRFNMTAKVSAQVLPWLKATYNNKWVREDYKRPSYMTGLFFHNIARIWPVNPVYDPNGHPIVDPNVNIVNGMTNGGVNENSKDYLYQSLNFVINPIKPLNIYLQNSYNTVNNDNFWDELPLYNYDNKNIPHLVPRNGGGAPGETKVSRSMWKNDYYSGRYFAEYADTFADKHDLKVVAGLDVEVNKWTEVGVTRKDLITPDIPTINTATNSTPDVRGPKNHWATMGLFARVNYTYDNRYLFEASVRRNGSSRFIGDKTWGVFPAFSLGWNVANEAFWSPIKAYVGQFKLRGSWGSLGNTNIKNLYPWAQTIKVTVGTESAGSHWLLNGKRQNTAGAAGIVSSSLTWERVENWNAGFDLSALDNRFQATFDYFVRSTKDMVGPPPPVTSLLGTAQPKANNSDLKSYGWELELRWRDAIGDFNYGAKFVLSDSQVEITKFYNPTNSIKTWYVGRKMGEIWGYESTGLAKTKAQMDEHLKKNKPTWGSNWDAGDVMYQDLNGDGKIDQGKLTTEDHGDLRVIGNSTPRYSYSFGLDMGWKGLDFSILLQGVGQRDFWDDSAYTFGATNKGIWQAAAFKEHLDYFRPEGDPLGANVNAYLPRPLLGAGWKNTKTQSHYLQDASYMRIKNMQLGYTLPKEWVKHLGLNRVRLYTSVDNLATFTNLTKIFDPEAITGGWSAGKVYPLQRTVSFGLNVNL